MWNTERDGEKEKVGNRPAKLNEIKSDRQPQQEIKKNGDVFFSKNNMKIL